MLTFAYIVEPALKHQHALASLSRQHKLPAVTGGRPHGGKRTYISLFSSAGVGCYGFDKDKYDCIATVELLPERLEIQRANGKCRYDSGYICGDMRSRQVHDRILEELRLWQDFERQHSVDVILATPPCQGMSTANYKKNDHEKVRNSLVTEAIRCIKELQPKVFILENVRAFLKTACTDLSGDDMSIGDSIALNLGPDYRIYSKVVNFKDYGVPSSRPRTLVIGTSRKLLNMSPLNLFPTRRKETTVREAIGDLSPLAYGEKDAHDFLHFARPYPQYMVKWIERLAQGQSAFDQSEDRRPYKTDTDGNRIPLKGGYMGNKYRRLYWDRPGACIATRNDQLASQDTIHPSDNRVLSIREVMRLMSVPDSFKWTADDSLVSPAASGDYLKRNELNIRRCLGEAVPTAIIRQIADKAFAMLAFEDFVTSYKAGDAAGILENEGLDLDFYTYTFLREQLIKDAKGSGSFYTPQSVVFDALKDVNIDKQDVRVLEPSVGMGAFLPQLSALLSHCGEIVIDAIEISPQVVSHLKEALAKIDLGFNLKVNVIQADFLEYPLDGRYDLVATNPPYGKATKAYAEIKGGEHKSGNLFALFMIKLRHAADDIVCVIPKNFVMAAEYDSVRRLYEPLPVVSVCDFGVKYFKKVFVEIITIHFSQGYSGNTTVCNSIEHAVVQHRQGYMFHDRVWLLYRDEWFDSYIAGMKLDVFDFFRDRQIVNSHLSEKGRIWVVKSKNILDDGRVVHVPGYDRYIDDCDRYAVSRFLDEEVCIMPNFTYNTRAAMLPKGSVPNGSIAVLLPKDGGRITDLRLYATEAFRRYYSTVKSHSRFTLNIDSSSVYYIGIPLTNDIDHGAV